ncbi:MAG: peptide chain release factor aRF-1 [Nitrososphaerales archaeon]
MPTSSSVALYKVKRLLSELSEKKGRGTELISLYIPPKKALHEVIAALRDEYGTASNIKSDSTRNHVMDALVKTMQRLKLYKATPENGLVIFCGALPTNGPGSETIFLYEVFPPKPVQTYLYRCDDHFHLDILKDMLKEEKTIGLLSIDATEAAVGIIAGSRFEVVDEITSGVSGKHRAGGQSARRFERLREMELTEYYHRVARHVNKALLEEKTVQGLIVGGPGGTKDTFLKGEFLDYRLRRIVLAVFDTSYAGREGLRELVDKAADVLQDVRLIEEKKLVNRFLREVNTSNGLAAYSVKDVLDALQKGSAETVLVSEDLEWLHMKAVCSKCGFTREVNVPRVNYIQEKQRLLSTPCDNCGSLEYEVSEMDFIEYLEDQANISSANVEVISSRSEEGAMLKSFGGVAALLRYKV